MKYEEEFDKYMEIRKTKMIRFEMSNIHELFDDDEETTEKTLQTITDKIAESKELDLIFLISSMTAF